MIKKLQFYKFYSSSPRRPTAKLLVRTTTTFEIMFLLMFIEWWNVIGKTLIDFSILTSSTGQTKPSQAKPAMNRSRLTVN